MIQLRRMEKLTEREFKILEFIRKNKQAGNAEILTYLGSISVEASKNHRDKRRKRIDKSRTC